MSHSRNALLSVLALGVGSAFGAFGSNDGQMQIIDPETGGLNADWQSNFLVSSRTEEGMYEQLLVDAGGYLPLMLQDAGVNMNDIGNVYVSHLHADHVCGLEALFISRYFAEKFGKIPRPNLFIHEALANPLWTRSLRGGLETLENVQADLTTYVNLRKVRRNGRFFLGGACFRLIQTVHIVADASIQHSFGLMIYVEGRKVYLTTDTQFAPNQIMRFWQEADVILQDCESGPKSGVHAHYDELLSLPSEIRNKMWLYHYGTGARERYNPVADGFRGFLRKHDRLEVLPDGQIQLVRHGVVI